MSSLQSFTISGQLVNVTQVALVDRDVAWKKVKDLEKEITDLRQRHQELSKKYEASQGSVRCLKGSLKKSENQSTSRLTTLKKAESYCEELEQKIERLEKRITELEQQRPTYMNEIVDLWQLLLMLVVELWSSPPRARHVAEVGCEGGSLTHWLKLDLLRMLNPWPKLGLGGSSAAA
ncbi:hypothetical protein Dimus_007830 [Dionaea muscipula]